MTYDDLLRELTRVARQMKARGVDRGEAERLTKESILDQCGDGPLVARLAFVAQVTPFAMKAIHDVYGKG